jgi:response regulator RpfG family c-di-GMP phosphodiesterase
MPDRTLIRIVQVENEPNLAALTESALESLGYQVLQSFASGEEFLEKAVELNPDLVLMDINLDGVLDGIRTSEELHRRVKAPVIFMSALHDDPTLERANRSNPLGYLVKPVPIQLLHAAIETALYRHQRDLERQELLEKTVGGSIRMLAEILSAVDPQSFGSAQKLKEYMSTMAQALKVENCWDLEIAALLSGIGYVMIPPSVIQKQRAGAPLTAVESSLVIRVPEFGRDLLMRIPHLESVANIVFYQNKNFDGTGFPNENVLGLRLPIGARLLKILADLINFSSQRGSKSLLLEQIRSYPGRYDPVLLNAVIAHIIEAPPKGATAVLLKDLKVGQVLKATIETHDGTVLLVAGNLITHLLLDKLRNFTQISGIQEPIYVEAEIGTAP